MGVRDSKDPDGPKLTLAPTAWHALTRRIKHGDHDLTPERRAPGQMAVGALCCLARPHVFR
ncbi:DUF397 domain-containing protein [Actinomadura sp. KC216]|nr:DUF397 domain-containing protein [Actinomadura sp. KC216]